MDVRNARIVNAVAARANDVARMTQAVAVRKTSVVVASDGWGAPSTTVDDVSTFDVPREWSDQAIQRVIDGFGPRTSGPDLLFAQGDGKVVAIFAPSLKSKVDVGDAVTLDGATYRVFAKSAGINESLERTLATVATAALGSMPTGQWASAARSSVSAAARHTSFVDFFRLPPAD